jgi:hypothetical protein
MRNAWSIHRGIGLALLLGACAPNTEVLDSWKDPNIPPQRYQKVLGVFISQDPSLRRAAEDELAKKLGNVVPSYSVLPEGIAQDMNRAKQWVQQQGFDGAVIMRPVKVDKETTYVPGSTYVVPAGYGSMWGYWGTGWGYAYDPGYVRQDEVVLVETNVYSVSNAKLVWASRTKSYNPESVRQLIDEIVDQTAAEMKKQKVVASS